METRLSSRSKPKIVAPRRWGVRKPLAIHWAMGRSGVASSCTQFLWAICRSQSIHTLCYRVMYWVLYLASFFSFLIASQECFCGVDQGSRVAPCTSKLLGCLVGLPTMASRSVLGSFQPGYLRWIDDLPKFIHAIFLLGSLLFTIPYLLHPTTISHSTSPYYPHARVEAAEIHQVSTCWSIAPLPTSTLWKLSLVPQESAPRSALPFDDVWWHKYYWFMGVSHS